MTGRHSTRGHVCLEITAYDTGTKSFMCYQTKILRRRRLQPVATMALGSLIALGITIALFGSVAPIPADPAPAAVIATAAAVIEAPVAVPDPPVLAPSLPRQRLQRQRRHIMVPRPLPTRVYPVIRQPVVDLPKEGKHRHDKARKSG